MPVYAELHDGRKLEFPDGTAPAVVQRTVKNLLAKAPPAPEGPQEGMGQAMLIAAGRGTDKVVQGVRQAYNWATGDQATLDKMAADEAEKDRLYKPLQEKFPNATAIAESAPSLAAGVATGGASLLSGAAAGAIPALLSYGSAEERLKRAAVDGVGGAGGVLLGRGVARVLKPAGVGAQPAERAAIKAAERVGMKPTPAQITDSPSLASFENYLLRSPGSSGAMKQVVDGNQTALNRAAARSMGEAADVLDEKVFAKASDRIGGEFTRLQAVTAPKLGDDFVDALVRIDTTNKARGPFASKQIDTLLDKGLELAAKGDLDGKAYKEIRTELSNQATAAFKAGDATTGQAYKAIRDALDDAAKASLPDADRVAWDTARKQWDAFKTLTKSNVAEGGNVSAARTAAAVRSKNPGFRAGKVNGELADIARIGEGFKGVPNPTSGQLLQQALYGNPITGLPLAAANRVAAGAYLSAPGYFTRGLLDVGETGRGLLSRAGAHLAIPGGRGLLGVE